MWWIYRFSTAHPQQKWKLLMGTSSIIRGNCSLPWLSTSKVSIYILLCGTFGSPRCSRCGVLWGLHTSERKKGHEGASPPFQATTWWGLLTLIFLFVLSFFHKYGCMIYSFLEVAEPGTAICYWWSFNSSDVRFQICYICWKVSDCHHLARNSRRARARRTRDWWHSKLNSRSMAWFWTMIPMWHLL